MHVVSRRWAIAAALAGILVVTLRPTGSPDVRAVNWWCIGCSELGTLDLLYNVALFVPLGAALRLGGASVARVVALSLALSASVEVLQLVVPGRDPTLSDVVANSLGGGLGAVLVRLFALLPAASRTAWCALTWSWVAVTFGVLSFGAWTVAVEVPRVDFIVQWLPDRLSYARFGGALYSFAANGVELPAAARIPVSRLPNVFFEGELDVTAHVTPGPRRDGIALIARLAVDYGEFLMLGRQHDALVVRYRANATRVGLRSPTYALAGALNGDPRGVVALRASKHRERLQLRATERHVRAPRAERYVRITAARLWAALLPFERGFAGGGVLGDVLWLALLTAPAAYAGARAHAGGRRLLPVVAQGAGFGLIALVMQPSLWWWPLWIGVAVGAVVGCWLGSRAYVSSRALMQRSPAPEFTSGVPAAP